MSNSQDLPPQLLSLPPRNDDDARSRVSTRSDGEGAIPATEDPEMELRKRLAESKRPKVPKAPRSAPPGPSLPDPIKGSTENRTRVLLEMVMPRVQEWVNDDLARRVQEHLESSVPAYVDSYWQDAQGEKVPQLAELVSRHLYEHYLNPSLPDSPLPEVVRNLVEEVLKEKGHELFAPAPRPDASPIGIAPRPVEPIKVYKGEPDSIQPPPAVPAEIPPVEPEGERLRTVYLPQFGTGDGPDPGDDGSGEDDDRCGRRDRRRKDGRRRSGDRDRDRRHNYDREDRSRRRRKKKDRRSSSSDSLSETSDSRYSDTEGSDTGSRVPESRRRNRLRIIRPMNELFRRALDYRRYRLDDLGPTSKRKQREVLSEANMTKVHRKLITQMKDRGFDGDDPITVLRFLAEYKSACDTHSVCEVVAFWAVQNYLSGQALSLVQNRMAGQTMSVDADREEMLTSYPELVNFMLETYATDDVIAEAVEDVESMRQSTGMTEQEFSNELWKRALRCGTVFSGNRLKGYFVEGLLPTMRDQVRNYAATHRRDGYQGVLRYARGLGSSYRALRRVNVPVAFRPTRDGRTVKPQRTALTVESSDTDPSVAAVNYGPEVMALSVNTGSVQSLPSVPPTPSTTVASAATSVAKPTGKSTNTPARCRICLSWGHTRCPLIPDPVLLDQVLAEREKNFQAGRNRFGNYRPGVQANRPPPPGTRVLPTAVNAVEEPLGPEELLPLGNTREEELAPEQGNEWEGP